MAPPLTAGSLSASRLTVSLMVVGSFGSTAERCTLSWRVAYSALLRPCEMTSSWARLSRMPALR